MMELLVRDEPIIFFERHYTQEEDAVLELLRPLGWKWYSRVAPRRSGGGRQDWGDIATLDENFPVLVKNLKFDTDNSAGQKIPYLNIIVPPSKDYKMQNVIKTKWNLKQDGKPYTPPPHCKGTDL
jgi:hypothetical protein